MIDLEKYRHYHFIGIGGIGMSALAEILLSDGYKVTGSDMKRSEITDHLASLGAEIFEGHEAENVDGADIVIYTVAIPKDNPEYSRAVVKGIPLFTRAELLGEMMRRKRYSIAISGAHGKTTTTSMISLILENAGFDPTLLVGGNLPEIHGNVKIGRSDYLVTESCEYKDSFLDMRPSVAVILNIAEEHLDYFTGGISQIKSSFEQFASLVPTNGKIIAGWQNQYVRDVLKGLDRNIITFGLGVGFDYYADNIEFNELGLPSFDAYCRGEYLGSAQMKIPGEHNVANAMAALACTHSLGAPADKALETLAGFTGTKRRFEFIRKMPSGTLLVDDYAHHPDEIRATLSAAKRIPAERVWCIFQPHTYTRLRDLMREFTDAFQDADVVLLAKVYPAREKDIYGVHSDDLYRNIKKKYPGKEVYYFDTFEEIADFVKKNVGEHDMAMTMGAGDIYKVLDLL